MYSAFLSRVFLFLHLFFIYTHLGDLKVVLNLAGAIEFSIRLLALDFQVDVHRGYAVANTSVTVSISKVNSGILELFTFPWFKVV